MEKYRATVYKYDACVLRLAYTYNAVGRFALTQPDRFATGASTRPRPFADPQTTTILNVQGVPEG